MKRENPTSIDTEAKTEHRYILGKVDYNGSGRRNCKAEITWTLNDGRFSMQAGIWNPRETHYYTCGQAIDTVAAFFPHNKRVQRMRAIWERWHLNDLTAGSPAQEAWLRANPLPQDYVGKGYELTCARLKDAGLNPDPSNGYKYGSAWLREELPAEIIAEIQSWSMARQQVAA